jgi:hypothetical protein
MAGRQGWNLRGAGQPWREARGPANHNWKGDVARVASGRARARRAYDLGPCVECGQPGRDRHHLDGDTLNNTPENVRALCRRCHMRSDGRLARAAELAAALSKPQAPKPCGVCGVPSKPLTNGRCKACLMYLRRTGAERPSELWGTRRRSSTERAAYLAQRAARPCASCSKATGLHSKVEIGACMARNARAAKARKEDAMGKDKGKRRPKPSRGATCIAPLDDEVHEGPRALEARLCGRPATTTRVVDGLVCALCGEHAAEIDGERERS